LHIKWLKQSVLLAYGDFTQTQVQITSNILTIINLRAKASHYILNFQYSKNGKTFRAETYYKDYRNLVKFDTKTALFNSVYDNTGSGYAKLGFVLERWKIIKEYWVSYSYIDTERIIKF
jgi:hypothetical protein